MCELTRFCLGIDMPLPLMIRADEMIE